LKSIIGPLFEILNQIVFAVLKSHH